MKWIVANAIGLLAAVAVFGTSITYAASGVEQVEQPVLNNVNDYLSDTTAADLIFPPPASASSNPQPLDPESSAQESSAESAEPSSEVSSMPPSSAPPSSAPPKPSSVPSSEPSSEPSSVPSSEPSSVPSSEPSSIPSSEPISSAPIAVGPVDEYLVDLVAGAVQREIVGVNTPPQARYYEAYKAQAVACHTYMEYHKKSDGSYPTMSYTAPHEQTKQLVREVVNQLIYYNGKIINAAYHASSGGHTQSAVYVWGNAIPYLVGVQSVYDDYQSNYTVAASDIEVKLRNAGIYVSGDPSTWFDLASASYSDGGFIDTISIVGQPVKGRTLRENIIGGANLKSCKITAINYDGVNLTFSTNGFGHGVGLSQIGSLGYSANENWSYLQILSHYYPGATIG